MGVCSVNASWEIIGRSLGDHSRDHEEIIGGITGEITRVHKIVLIVGVDDDLVTISLQSRYNLVTISCLLPVASLLCELVVEKAPRVLARPPQLPFMYKSIG